MNVPPMSSGPYSGHNDETDATSLGHEPPENAG